MRETNMNKIEYNQKYFRVGMYIANENGSIHQITRLQSRYKCSVNNDPYFCAKCIETNRENDNYMYNYDWEILWGRSTKLWKAMHE